MSVNENKFVDITQNFVHDELNIKVEDCSGDEENSGHEFSVSEIKCGDIFHSANGLFVFCCYYCSERFAAIEEFVSHFEEKHANTLTTTETNETSLNLREVEEANEYLGSEASENLPWITDNPIRIEENLDPGNGVSTDLFNDAEMNVEKAPKVYSGPEIQCPKCPYTFRWKNLLVHHLRRFHNDYSGKLLKDAIINAEPNVESKIKITKVQGNVDERVISEWPETQELEEDAEMRNPTIDSCEIEESYHQEGESFHTVRSNWKHWEELQSSNSIFLSPAELRVAHDKSHTPERPYQCMVCLKAFRLKKFLDQHKSVHTGERPFKCPECPGAFTQKGSLTVHYKRVHLKEKNFSCDHCDKRFASNADRKTHTRTHFNEKPYQCDECGKKFTKSGGLTFHKRQHTQITYERETLPVHRLPIKIYNPKTSEKTHEIAFRREELCMQDLQKDFCTKF